MNPISQQKQLFGKVSIVKNGLNCTVSHNQQLSGMASIIPSKATPTYMLTTEDGHEIPAVVVDEAVVFTATPNDIRAGTVAVTASGVTEGTKIIPAYHTEEGYTRIAPGKPLTIEMFSDMCQYTGLQAIVCLFDGTIAESVAAEMVVIEGKLYPVHSADATASVTVDTENQTINLGITNTGDDHVVIRYFTYREEY